MTEFLTANNLTETASELASKVFILSSTGVSTKLSHAFHCRVSTRILKKVILIKKMFETMIIDREVCLG